MTPIRATPDASRSLAIGWMLVLPNNNFDVILIHHFAQTSHPPLPKLSKNPTILSFCSIFLNLELKPPFIVAS